LAAILFDLGGTHIRCGVALTCADASSATLACRQKSRIPNFLTLSSPEQVWDGLLELIGRYVGTVAELVRPSDPVVLAFPGPIDSEGKIIAAPTIVGQQPTFPDLQEAVSRATGRPTYLLNDMSAAAWRLSATTDARRFIIATVSSGIGSKIFDRTSALGVIDDVPYAGEIGHVMVDRDPRAPLCDCGGRGHLGAIASGRGIERAARQKADRDRDGFARSLCSSQFGATSISISNEKHLVPAARAGDDWTLALILQCTEPLGQILASVTVALGLDRIAVMGGFAQSLGSPYLSILKQTLKNYDAFPGFPTFDSCLIELCEPDDEVCLLGAATYAHKRLGVR
jgi:predicted NBD/HSP70 family sugar kinase